MCIFCKPELNSLTCLFVASVASSDFRARLLKAAVAVSSSSKPTTRCCCSPPLQRPCRQVLNKPLLQQSEIVIRWVNSLVSVLTVGLSYGAMNVLSYTICMMQHFLAFRDNPIIPGRRFACTHSIAENCGGADLKWDGSGHLLSV